MYTVDTENLLYTKNTSCTELPKHKEYTHAVDTMTENLPNTRNKKNLIAKHKD